MVSLNSMLMAQPKAQFGICHPKEGCACPGAAVVPGLTPQAPAMIGIVGYKPTPEQQGTLERSGVHVNPKTEDVILFPANLFAQMSAGLLTQGIKEQAAVAKPEERFSVHI